MTSAADQASEDAAERRHHRDERVAERVHEHDGPLAQALRVRGADEVLAEHVERLRPQDPRVVRDARERQHEGRQRDVLQPVEDVHLILAHRQHPLRREPAQADREQDDEDLAEPERGDGVTGHPEHADDAVGPGTALQRGDDAERDADDELQDQRGQRELQGVRKPLEDHLARLAVVDERFAEVEPDGVGHPVHVLERDRLVEPVGVDQPEVVLLREVTDAEGEEPDRIARREARDRERDDRDADQGGDRVERPPDEEVAHRASVDRRGSALAGAPSDSDRGYFLIHHW